MAVEIGFVAEVMKWTKTFWEWISDMFWFFKNVRKLRPILQSATGSEPLCPRNHGVMEFVNEERHIMNRYDSVFERKRHYRCAHCDYSTYTIYVIKRV